MTNKVNNNDKLTYDDVCEWAILPTLAQEDIALYVTQEICKQIKKDKTINENFLFNHGELQKIWQTHIFFINLQAKIFVALCLLCV